jgi:hypothetical protein
MRGACHAAQANIQMVFKYIHAMNVNQDSLLGLGLQCAHLAPWAGITQKQTYHVHSASLGDIHPEREA